MSVSKTNKPKLIIGIGASAGGLDAFRAFFSKIPKNTGMAFVLLPHLDPSHHSLMAPLLANKINMTVLEAKDNMIVEADHVYILPPGKEITITDLHLHLNEVTLPRQQWTAIEHFLSSLAKDQAERGVGIILSGTGSHGTLSFRDIKLAGGMILAQDPSTTPHGQMPQSAINTGLVDLIVAPEDMPAILIEYASHPYLEQTTNAITEEILQNMYRILAYLCTRIKYDFSGYRQNMLLRRIQRRMCVNQTNNLDAYYDFLKANPKEAIALHKDLLIGVTAFFRDKDAFQILIEEVMPELVSTCTEEKPVRIWVPACSTGEEVYTITMLVFEAFEQAKKNVTAQIFASDINDESLKVAREGVYPKSIERDISSDRLARFFELTANDEYQVKKVLRETIIFANQNLISDTPFSRLDLISCRNLFIYLQPALQHNVLNTFHFSLNLGAVLMLGPSESLGKNKSQFEILSKKWRLFKSIKATNKLPVNFPIERLSQLSFPAKSFHKSGDYQTTSPARFAELVNRDLLEEYAPAAVLINRVYEILHFQGPTVNFLEFPKGMPTHDLMTLLREGLRARIRTAVDYALKVNQPIVDLEAKVKRNGHYLPCTLTVRPVFDPKLPSDLLLITFEEKTGSASNKVIPTTTLNLSEQNSDIVEQLEYELNATREDLYSTVEELESSNEELKASNEEVMSMNEELQSANEELETSKEELQSMNEELNTVNSELHFKVEELEKSYDDTQNLLSSTDIATLFLDRKLQIRLFNPAIGQLLNLRESDIGRSISDFSAKVANSDLLTDAHLVLEKLSPIEKDVWSVGNTQKSRCYLRRIVPYRTVDDHINGVVITFVEITKRYEQKILLEQRVLERTKSLNDREARLTSIMQFASEAIVVMNDNGSITDFNQAAEMMFGYQFNEISGVNIKKLVPLVQLERRKSKDKIDLELQNKIIALSPQELNAIRKDGSEFPIKLTTTIIANDKICIGIISDLSEVTILKKAIVDVSTIEQEKIGREVHDNLGQRLTGINLLISDLQRKLSVDDIRSGKQLEQIMEQISLAIGETRNISHGLSPILFPPQKLQDALIELIGMADKANIQNDCEFSQILNIPDNTVAVQIYRIAQEAMNNAIKYSKASHITLQLKTHTDKMMLVIQDNGVGIELKGNKENWGMGLKIMQYRASSINANLIIESSPNNGTIVRCLF
ncbi:CheR family methyltransferase [Candidatus Colwellia aromaticivorans]|uniref:CheR family methyltransferase n=1 Tax=Candidatus Colwellia aromaticivorans TaxID=2267621 RepID=UPI000DF1B234|nr:CheR family methyltransferase [Candidatus Colwellia aromaticivorans]